MLQATGRYHVLGPISYAYDGERRSASAGDLVELDPLDATSLGDLVRAEEESIEG